MCSTVATYANVHDEMRKVFAKEADVNVPCPECGSSRYAKDVYSIAYRNKSWNVTRFPKIMEMDVNTALTACNDLKTVSRWLEVLWELGLGYLTLGEEILGLSGGEAQRLKLPSEMGKAQTDSVFVFDEPTIGLHSLDMRMLLGVFRTLVKNGATVIIIEHNLSVIRSANHIINMSLGGAEDGVRIVTTGTP